jgi:hypothetical protein
VQRAQIIWRARCGESASAIAARVGLDGETVRKRIRRFNAEGVEALKDRPRSGRRPTYSPEQTATVIASALSKPQTLDFAHLVTPSLVVCGADDNPRFTSRGPEWHADAYHDGPGARALLTLHGVGHGLGGIAGLDAKETEVEAPDGLEATKRMTLAWLRTILGYDAAAWTSACAAIAGPASALGQIEEKSSS